DVVEYHLPMRVNRVVANPLLKADTLRTALQRGPLVYCVEGADGNGKAWNIVLPENARFTTHPESILGEQVTVLRGNAETAVIAPDGRNLRMEESTITAIPYYIWANRGENEMQVWLPTTIREVRITN
ncbi:MAG TPA: glycoside hydrolase family 127 protein, partial [Bacteroidota bacterium]|nr:glycoside hydrolase family 127 protein [Bacteroidota bacterium]